ncbi:uncharacterized protein BJ212DRAFT_1304624 [Suillus subaureus]|uniref:Uncharacterized protein n=1 Tax=Suillus subaureus TaxID=48587 RepID=A0A9P7DUH0_9AGAM|nr:uncharacterized protein BJ212DRAFT_1304624 [Suillus subaureus]KAG1803296.1 hypothetical protein BJ212DRAFT_1304624 [Suillus subaureus]
MLEEYMTNGVNDEQIKSLNEFVIHNHWDWLFVEFNELPDDADMYLEADPLYMENKKLFKTGWGVKEDNILTMLGQVDNAWMLEGLNPSEMFKKPMEAALKELKKGGEGINIAYNENVELPDKWHESHEPPIQFIRFILDKPLAKEKVECGDFLREIMDILVTDKT